MESNKSKLKEMQRAFNDRDYVDFTLICASPLVENFHKNITSDEVHLLWSLQGLTSEVGEVSEVVEKAIRKKGKIEQEDYNKLIDELSDVIYWVQSVLNYIPNDGKGKNDINHLVKYNMGKLIKRQEEKEKKE